MEMEHEEDVNDGGSEEFGDLPLPARWHCAIRRRLLPDHPLFHEGTIACNMNYSKWTMDGDDDQQYDLSRISKEFVCREKGCKKSFDNLTSYERHYQMEHRYTCATCKRLFPNGHLLDLHVAEWHDTMFQVQAQQKPMYRCLLEACEDVFMEPKQRKDHMIRVHKYPSNFRFDRNRKGNREQKSSKDVQMADSTDVSTNEEASRSDVFPSEPMSGILTESANQVSDTKPAESRFKYSYKVPKSICFGQGAQRGFQRSRGKSRHWHQLHRPDTDTTVSIENIDMTELLDAVDS